MNISGGAVKRAGIVAIALFTILTFHACATFAPGTRFGLEIRETFHLSSVPRFVKALGTLSKGAVYDFRFVYDNGKTEDFRSASTLNIKTERVTLFEVPKSTSAGEYTPIGAHVTQRVYSNNAKDIQAVLDQLK